MSEQRLDGKAELEEMRNKLKIEAGRCRSKLIHFEFDYISEKETEEHKQREIEIIQLKNRWNHALQSLFYIEQELQMRNKKLL